MSISLSKKRLIEITSGRTITGPSDSKLVFSGLEYDSRQVKGGELFVALAGAEAHGEKYLEQALRNGAAMALVESENLLQHPEAARFVVVKDSLEAFSAVASTWRRDVGIPIMAITGSVGKTTTKELAAAILLRRCPGAFSLKSHNNHVGVPYTLCRLSRNHSWAVLEMGMNHAGEILRLTKIAEPTSAAITRIAPAHIEFFGRLEKIAEAKLEILAGLKPGASVLINGDDEVLSDVLKAGGIENRFTIRRFGAGDGSDVQVSWIKPHGLEGIEFGLILNGHEHRVTMSVPGRQTAFNAACAALVVQTLFPDFPEEEIVAGLAAFTAPLMRLQVHELPDGRRVIDDSYNANPVSMQACMSLASDLKESGSRVGLILGDMRELGALSEKYHRELGQQAAKAAPAFVILVGEFSQVVGQPLQAGGIPVYFAKTPEEAGREAFSRACDVVIVKASRTVGLERAVAALEHQGEPKRG